MQNRRSSVSACHVNAARYAVRLPHGLPLFYNVNYRFANASSSFAVAPNQQGGLSFACIESLEFVAIPLAEQETNKNSLSVPLCQISTTPFFA
jgi:hypothetical protein